MQFPARAEPMLGCNRQLVGLWPPRRDCFTPSMRACPRPWNHWQAGLGPERWSCQTEMSDASTEGRPGLPRRKPRHSSRRPPGGTSSGWTHTGRARRGDGCRPPGGGPGPLLQRGPLFHDAEVASVSALATSRLRGQALPPVRRADVFGDHAVSCKHSGLGDMRLGTQTFFCQVLAQSRVPHDRELDIAGNGRRPPTFC